MGPWRKPRVTLLAIGLFGLIPCPRADATFITFSDRNASNAAVDSDPSLAKTAQGWDTVPSGTTLVNGSSFGGVTSHASGGNTLVTNAFPEWSQPNTLGETPNQFFLAGQSITLTIAQPILAFGISINTSATVSE